MRRRLLAAAMVLALSATGCGAAGQPFPGEGSSQSTASNRARASADARDLLATVRVPAGSRVVATPNTDLFEHVREFIGAPASAYASRSWLIHGSGDHALRYAVAHLHPGSKIQSTGSGDVESEIRIWPPVPGVLIGRWLQLQSSAIGTRTYLTASAQSQWDILRPANERIPQDVAKITVRVTDASGHRVHQLTVRNHRLVHHVVGLYNALGVIQPAEIMGCPGEPAGVLTLSFYSSSADVIATASSSTLASTHMPPSAAAWACFPIKVTLADQHYPSLSGDVIAPLARLLHTRLTP